jgi:phage head maturation protease
MTRVYLPENVGLQASYPINWAAVNETRVGAWASSKPWQPIISGLIPWGVTADGRDDHGYKNCFVKGAFRWGGNDVNLLIDHEGEPLASLKAGNLRLSNEPEGLRWEAVPKDCPEFWALVLPALSRKLGSSPGFNPEVFYRFNANDRTIHRAQLLEISLTQWPGFEVTTRTTAVNIRRLLETSRAPDDLQDRWVRQELYLAQWR